jgi:hypothetical protein
MSKTTKHKIEGKKFGRLTAIKFLPDGGRHAAFLFKCDCGAEKIILAYKVLTSGTKSCGCHRRERASQINRTHGQAGKKCTRTYSSWVSMMDRGVWGSDPEKFAMYGAAGRGVCERWHRFEHFFVDMGERPEGTSIDRIDNDKGYEPGNCRWATPREQARNRSNTVRVRYGGEATTMVELCEHLGLPLSAVRSRAYKRGNDFVAALQSMGVDCVVAE